MIETINVKDIATYCNKGIKIEELKSVNYFYGTNGSGKTTLSNVISNPVENKNCEIFWKNGITLKALVYNKRFVEKNFHSSDEIKGIFTLGEETDEIKSKIEESKLELVQRTEELIKYNNLMKVKNDFDKSNEIEFNEVCWELKKKYEGTFTNAFKGYTGSKKDFKNKCKIEQNNLSELMTLDSLVEKSKILFQSDTEIISEIPLINYSDIEQYEINVIYSKRIIGKEDVNISAMIKKLNNSDWVKEGIDYYSINNEICPFCQQKTDKDFTKSLNEYFDETFLEETLIVKNNKNQYEVQINNVINGLERIIIDNNKYLNVDKLTERKNLLVSKANLNLMKIEEKVKEPSTIISLDSTFSELCEIIEILKEANLKIKEHNLLINNIGNERKKLVAKIWKFIVNENSKNFKNYIEKKNSNDKAISGLAAKIKDEEDKMLSIKRTIISLENQITSVTPTINEINKILNSFGFNNFSLKEADEKGYYKIIRNNGESAKETLSEGEKTFITFLYFYHLLKGSTESSDITVDRIVVFDDPISSLDSNILFIVSNLIRKIIDDIKSKRENIKQIFILTHNVYFHKEVSFNKDKRNKFKDETFWIIRKNCGVSQIKKYDKNPVKTSYELLWQEIKESQFQNFITIQNILRRIIENYFKILGNLEDDDIIDKFDGEEKIICKSLISWVNDGSHYINDDVFVDSGFEAIEKYLEVFKKIFEKTKQIEHYNMMMGINEA